MTALKWLLVVLALVVAWWARYERVQGKRRDYV